MKMAWAESLGKECGLETPLEWYRNITDHCLSLFEYSKIQEELNELYNDYVSIYGEPDDN